MYSIARPVRFPSHKIGLVERRIARALREAGQPSLTSGLATLHHFPNGPLMQQVVNSLTVNETYFYRELEQLKVLCRNLLPSINRPAGPLRVLSLPCSTGEEPYSIAIYCSDNLLASLVPRLQITAADIDSAALKKAKAGVFGDCAASRLPGHVMKRFFRPVSDGSGNFQIDPKLAKSINFANANLLDPAISRQFRMFDVIFCRNVLIYFDARAKQTAISNMYQMLRPGGVLLLGYAEQLAKTDALF